MDRNDACYEFYRPFHDTRRGQIIGLATPKHQLRDALAIAQLVRRLPYDGIVVEPGRPSIQPAENIILVGSPLLFVEPDAHPISGDALPFPVGDAKLGARLRNTFGGSCLLFRNGDGGRRLVNEVTKETYARGGKPGTGFLEDHGVVRRVFRAPFDNLVTVEGTTGLGTLGAAKVATCPLCLAAIWSAVGKLDVFDESRPLEILVRATFCGENGLDVYSLDTVKAVPLLVVYNRQWVFDLVDGRRWTDQLPWDVRVRMRGDEPASAAPAGEPKVLPRLEVEADLRGADPSLSALVRDVLVPAFPRDGAKAVVPSAQDAAEVVARLAGETDRFRVLLLDGPQFAAESERQIDLPQGRSRIRKLRKRFLVILALCRLLGCRFRRDEASIRRLFPDFEGGKSAKPLLAQWVGAVPGRMREGFEPLLGEARHPKDLVHIQSSRRDHGYALALNRASLVIRMRLD